MCIRDRGRAPFYWPLGLAVLALGSVVVPWRASLTTFGAVSYTHLPVCDYGRNKVACERAFQRAAERGAFKTTIVRPSHTYGPGGSLIDQQEFDSGTWEDVYKRQSWARQRWLQ